MSLGPLTLGQTHDIVVPMDISRCRETCPYLDVVLEYTKSDGTMVRSSLATCFFPASLSLSQNDWNIEYSSLALNVYTITHNSR